MADQKRWFKLWHSSLSDDEIVSLPPELRWAWAAFGAHTKVHGKVGKVTVSVKNSVLAVQMGIPVSDLKKTIKMFPNLTVQDEKSDNGRFAVTWHKWIYYQEDSTVANRVSRLRLKRRGEERRSEEIKSPPKGSPANNRKITEEMTLIFEFLKWGFEHPGWSLTADRKRFLKARLKRYTVKDCLKAIVGCSKDDFYMGRQDGREPMDDISNVFRNDSRLEKFRETITDKELDDEISRYEKETGKELRWESNPPELVHSGGNGEAKAEGN